MLSLLLLAHWFCHTLCVSQPEDLFSNAARNYLVDRQPLAAKLRPQTLDDYVGQRHLVGKGAALRLLIETDKLTSIILWGPAGVGKTSLARVIANSTSKHFVELSAVSATVKDVRQVIESARERLGQFGQSTILFLDEVHRFNKAQQDSLLPVVEQGLIVLIGATTENPFFEVNAPLLSRSTVFRLNELEAQDIEVLIQKGAEFEQVEVTSEASQYLAAQVNGDGRKSLTTLDLAIALAHGKHTKTIAKEHIEMALSTNAMGYGTTQHYDTVSAFIKSIRGSDPDAALYWLARMLEAGEDARFIARRLVVHASEDIGMADSQALLIANAAAHAVEFVGLPEARLNLAHATTYLATAPKSNRVYAALGAAQKAVAESTPVVPAHLRDGSHSGAKGLGHGAGYLYPHSDERGWLPQQYLPDDLCDAQFYFPTTRGEEAKIAERLARIARLKSQNTQS